MDGFVKIMHGALGVLALKDRNSLAILSWSADHASIKDNPVTGRKIGEATIGKNLFTQLTYEEYRQAKKRIEKYGYAALKATNKGTIISLQGYGFAEFGPHTTTPEATPQQHPGNTPATPKEEGKKVRTKNKYNPPTPQGVLDEVWQEYMRTRKSLNAPNSQRAIVTLTNKIEKVSVEYKVSPNSLVETANLNGWKTVFPPKEDRNANRNPSPRQITAALTTPGAGRTIFDSPVDLQRPVHQIGREPDRQNAPLEQLAFTSTGHPDSGGGDVGR